MNLINSDLRTNDITKYSANEFNSAFIYFKNKETITNLSLNIKVIVLYIIQLSKEYDLDLKSEYFKNELFQKMNMSDNLLHVGIGNIVYNIIGGNRDCNNCKIVEDYSKLQKQATTDCLTGLFNRGPIEEEIEKQISIKKRNGTDTVILMIDIDYFKKINDTYGHSKGDKVLIEISKLFKNNTRNEDTIGRMGGEEFIIILPGINIINGKKVAEKIRTEIECNLSQNIKGIDKSITVSIGITALSKLDNTGKKAQDRADIALYEAKNNGRNQVCIKIKKEEQK